MVDIDSDVVELCREHLREWHRGSFDDPRLELVISDARDYLEGSEELFDVIIIDIPEPLENSPALKLFTKQFYTLLRERLAPGGVIALQADDLSSAFLEPHCAIFNTVGEVLPYLHSYRAFIPSFNTMWGYIIAARDFDPAGSAQASSTAALKNGVGLRFYDEEPRGMLPCPGISASGGKR